MSWDNWRDWSEALKGPQARDQNQPEEACLDDEEVTGTQRKRKWIHGKLVYHLSFSSWLDQHDWLFMSSTIGPKPELADEPEWLWEIQLGASSHGRLAVHQKNGQQQHCTRAAKWRKCGRDRSRESQLTATERNSHLLSGTTTERIALFSWLMRQTRYGWTDWLIVVHNDKKVETWKHCECCFRKLNMILNLLCDRKGK